MVAYYFPGRCPVEGGNTWSKPQFLRSFAPRLGRISPYLTGIRRGEKGIEAGLLISLTTTMAVQRRDQDIPYYPL